MYQFGSRYSPGERSMAHNGSLQSSRINFGYFNFQNRPQPSRWQMNNQYHSRSWFDNSIPHSPQFSNGYFSRTFTSNGRSRHRSDYQHQKANNQNSRIRNRIESETDMDLSGEIKALYHEKKQTEQVFRRKLELRRLIWDELIVFFEAEVDLYVVGSSINGLGTLFSELDICVLFKNTRVDSIQALQSIGAILNKKDFVKNKRLILAKVPILKFIDATSGVVVNINVNNTTCIRNTQLIHEYVKMDDRVAPLTIAIKLWARQNGINDASNKTMNGYTLTLLVIHFLQSRCNPAILPSLPEIPRNESEAFGQQRHMKQRYYFKSANTESLGDLLLKFLNYYSYEFTYRINVVSVRIGTPIAKNKMNEAQNNKFESTQWKFIGVEEPFDRTNTARSVCDKIAFDHILDVFRRSYHTLKESQCLFSIF